MPPGGAGPRSHTRRLAIGVAIGGALLLALGAGIWMRSLTWEHTAPIRFRGDLGNGYRWGWWANRVGYVNLYDEIARSSGTGYPVDYPPLRLLVMSRWAKWVRWRHAGDHAASAAATPLRLLNLACELVTAVGIGLLVRLWTAASAAGADAPRAARRGWMLGAGAALLFWFNPAIILNAHGFPQWDVWALPFFVAAVLLSSAGWWFSSGVLIATGSTLKGQILLVAPLFILWPLFARRWTLIPRWLVGFTTAMALIASPWLIRQPAAAGWIACVLGALVVLGVWGHGRALTVRRGAAVLAATALLSWPWLLDQSGHGAALGALFTAGVVGAAQMLPRRHWPLAAPAVLAVALLVAARLFDGSFAWLSVGFRHGVMRWPALARANVANVPAILGARFGFTPDDVVFALPGFAETATLGIKSVLILSYCLALVLCAKAAAMQERRRDARFLIAVTAPWVLLFLLLPQMHTRHLVYGAGLTAVAVGVGAGSTLVHLALTLVSTSMMAHTMLASNKETVPAVIRWLTRPDVGWGLALCAAALLFTAFCSRPRAPSTTASAAN